MPPPLPIREVAEMRRRGVERAKEVCAIQEGAKWIQGFVQGHRADALRILDFAHAASYVTEMAAKVREAAGHLPAKWEDGVLHRLKHEGPARLLRHLSRLALRSPQIQEQVNYLQKRQQLMESPTYRTEGWPSGSGSVESSHKFVVQARLKGAGMHWKPEHINRLRARMIEQAAQASAAAESTAGQGLVCEHCRQPLQARGRAKRCWQTQGGQQVEVERTYVSCPQCGGGFFPPGERIAGPRWPSVAACSRNPGELEQRTAL